MAKVDKIQIDTYHALYTDRVSIKSFTRIGFEGEAISYFPGDNGYEIYAAGKYKLNRII